MDCPKLLGDKAAQEDRLSQINEPHVARLTEFVHSLRIRVGSNAAIPYFDPWDGGAEAEVLFLLEAPGAKAKKSGFVSMNNPDESAKNFFELVHACGIDRHRIAIWNTVPWYIGSDVKIRPARSSDLALGIESLAELLQLIPKLRAIVLVGEKAQKATNHVKTIAPSIEIFSSPHPSPMFVNRRPENRNTIMNSWRFVRMYLENL